MLLHYEVMNRKGAKVPGTIFRSYGARAKGVICWFVLILEEGPRITTQQALTGGNGIGDCDD